MNEIEEIKKLRKDLESWKREYSELIIIIDVDWLLFLTEEAFLANVGYIEQRLLALGAIKPEEMTV